MALCPIANLDSPMPVLGREASRSFKPIFNRTQEVLQHTFGLKLTELPARERVTVAQKRAAQRATGNSQGTSNKASASWILTSTLPAPFRASNILRPPTAGVAGLEASYVGLYTFVVGLIYLSQGQRVTEGKLERHLKRVNADNSVLGGEKIDKVLKRMEREGYIVKIKEREVGGEETIEWVVGPRGKVEIGPEGVAGLVTEIWGPETDMGDLGKRLERSLGTGIAGKENEGDEDEEGPAEEADEQRQEGRRRGKRRRGNEDSEEE